jgi:hypothetical protein
MNRPGCGSNSAVDPSRLASLAPQDDGLSNGMREYMKR